MNDEEGGPDQGLECTNDVLAGSMGLLSVPDRCSDEPEPVDGAAAWPPVGRLLS
jgi:hypothetical protein